MRSTAVFLAITATACLARASGLSDGVAILRSDERGVTFVWTPGEATVVRASGFDGVVIDVPGATQVGRAGEPGVPVRVFPVALPPGAKPTVASIDAQWELREGDVLAPIPTPVGYTRESARYDVIADPLAYAMDVEYPASPVSVVQTRPVRGTNVAFVGVAAARHNPARKTTYVLRSATVSVSFVGGRGVESAAPIGPLDRYLQASLLNGQQARSFIGAAEALPGILQFPQVNPFEDGPEWYVAKVRRTGIVEVRRSDLSAAGMPVSSVDPRTIRVFTSDQSPIVYDNAVERPALTECPIYVTGESDGVFDAGDVILFYGRGPDGYVSVDSTTRYVIHPYSDSTTYWITYDGSFPTQPLRMATLDGSASGTLVGGVVRRARYETNVLIPYDRYNEVSDYHYWYEFLGKSKNVYLTTTGAVGGTDTLVVSTRNFFGPGYPVAEVNGEDATYLRVDNGENGNNLAVLTTNALSDGTNAISMVFSPSPYYVDSVDVFFDYVEVTYRGNASAFEDRVWFEKPPESSGAVRYRATGFSSEPMAFEVSDPFDVRRVVGGSYSGGALTFTDPSADGPRWYEVCVSSARVRPVAVRRAALVGLREPDLPANRADYVVIAPGVLVSEAERLADHRESRGLSARVVTVESIYDEFGFGQRDVSAIKDFCRFAFEYWRDANHAPPSYVCLFGDGHYDHRNYQASTPSYIPPYTDVSGGWLGNVSDDWYVFFSRAGSFDSDSNGAPDVLIGRLNVNSLSEAAATVDKIIAYEASPELHPWRNTICFVADDEYAGSQQNESIHTYQSETLERWHTPEYVEDRKVYLMEYAFDALREKPAAREAIIDAWSDGAVIVNYIGHGNKDVWAHEHVFRRAVDVPRLPQSARLPMVYTASCSIGFFDHPTAPGMAEELVRTPGAGAIGSISATRAVYASANADLNQNYFDALFSAARPSQGGALFIAKMNVSAYPNVYNHTRFIVLGDPATDLAIPDLRVRVTDVSPDTIYALQTVTVSGEVIDADSNVVTSFDGIVTLRAFDALRPRVHYMPNGTGVGYTLPGRPMFRGPASVEDGTFTVTFIAPKDISYGETTAKIIAYVEDGTVDGSGEESNLALGGSTDIPLDTIGPEVAIGFVGQDFSSGDPVGSSPILAAACADPVGINITGAFGHGMLLVVDGDLGSAIDVTDAFEYDMGSHTRGTVTYPLELEPGAHALSLKVWDNANNSTVAAADVIVAAPGSFAVREVLNYPNPFPRVTTFTYLLSDAAGDAEVMVFTVAGRRIRTLRGTGYAGFNQVHWDGRDDDGDLISNGVYIVKVVATSAATGERSHAFAKAVVAH